MYQQHKESGIKQQSKTISIVWNSHSLKVYQVYSKDWTFIHEANCQIYVNLGLVKRRCKNAQSPITNNFAMFNSVVFGGFKLSSLLQ